MNALANPLSLCMKRRHTAQMPKKHFFKLSIIFQPTDQTSFSLPMRAFSFLSSSILDHYNLPPAKSLDAFFKAPIFTDLNHPLSPYLYPNR